jgi:tungstate transport system substrate-binding protein
MNKLAMRLVALIMVLGLLAGCGQPAPTATPTQVPPTQVPPTAVPPTAVPPTAVPPEPAKLVLATTTSTNDSGLLDYILPDFEQEYNADVEVIAVGTGQALQLGRDGNADVLLVHARALEDEFMAEGHGVRREDVMYNDFVIVGPADDPAGIKGRKNAAKAFGMIAEAQAKFVSRGDESGTHTKEKAIWAAADMEPSGGWYISAGQGMGAVLTMANEQLAYTLSDRATYLAQKENLDLEILVEGDSVLFNPYGVIAVNPAKSDQINNELANDFIDWLTSVPVQEKIGEFGMDRFGLPLFFPDSEPYRAAHAAAAEAALKITGMVDQEMAWTEEEVKAMPTMEAERENNAGQMETYTGVSIGSLLQMAGPKAGADTVTFIADDGYSADVPLADVLACEDCIFSFRTQGGFSVVMPGFSSGAQVKGVVEVQVTGTEAAAPVALQITGMVEIEQAWTEAEVKAQPTMEAERANKEGQMETYTGVSIAALLEIAQPKSDATTVVFVADDGYSAEATLEEVMQCPNCIVSFRSQGGFSIVMPDFASSLQVKGVIEIQVK